MNKVKCPKCGNEQVVALEQRHDSQDYDSKELGIKDLPSVRDRIIAGVVGYRNIYAIARCLIDDCRISYLVERNYKGNPWQVQSISPSVEKIGEGVPPLVDEAYRQAVVCLAIDCPDASIAMCRASLDRMTKEQKADGNTLKARLDNLVKKGVLKSSIITEAVNVREFGNAALHDLLAEEISAEDADIICEFTKGILYDIYVTPELARKAEERRQRLQKGET
ncbi:DUF4145 domain-containing protein [Chloroflexota bacterium]